MTPTIRDQAIGDPDGIREVFMAWGEMVGYPVVKMGPLDFPKGRWEWHRLIRTSSPTKLGDAWADGERRGQERRGRDDKRQG
jgi:hypothetical protein